MVGARSRSVRRRVALAALVLVALTAACAACHNATAQPLAELLNIHHQPAPAEQVDHVESDNSGQAATQRFTQEQAAKGARVMGGAGMCRIAPDRGGAT